QEAKESKVRKNSELQLQQEAAHIIEMSSFGKHQEEDSMEAEGEDIREKQEAAGTENKTGEKKESSGDGTKKTEKNGKQEKEGKSFKGDKGRARGDRSFSDFKRSVKRSDNPDVLYGRDFEDEVIPLESIQTEMGEGCVRGQGVTLETGESRVEREITIFCVRDYC